MTNSTDKARTMARSDTESLRIYRAPDNAYENARRVALSETPEYREMIQDRLDNDHDDITLDEAIRLIPMEQEAFIIHLERANDECL